jgi:hypothetical protein
MDGINFMLAPDVSPGLHLIQLDRITRYTATWLGNIQTPSRADSPGSYHTKTNSQMLP